MRPFPLVGFLCVAFAALPLSAQNPDLKKPMADRAEMMKKAMEKFDLNGDGKIDESEQQKAAEQFKGIPDDRLPPQLQAMLDRNGDGKVDPQELALGREMMLRMRGGQGGGGGFGGGGGGFAGPTQGGFGNQIPPDVLKKFDKNKDGKLDETEEKNAMAAMQGNPKTRSQLVKEKLDLDGDGKVSAEEKAARREELKSKSKSKKKEK